MFASSSIPRHLARGLLGFALLFAAAAGAALLTPLALLLLPLAGVAWRGCPACWAIGLAQTCVRPRAAAARRP